MKKSLLKAILERISQYRDKAQYFLLMLEESKEEDMVFVDKLYDEIMYNIKQINSKDQLQKISDELKIIKEKELIEEKKSEQELADLESLISSLS